MAAQHLLVTRRTLLLGAAGLVGGTLLAGCGSDGSGTDAGEFVVAPRFPNVKAFAPGRVRLPVSLTDADASLLTTGPATLTGSIRTDSGDQVTAITVARRGAGLAAPYWPIVADLPAAGLYQISIDGAIGDPTPVMVYEPADVTVPVTGSALPGFDTPTFDDARGVDPICTLDPGPCPFHAVTLNQAVARGRPVVYMVGTPAHCQFATCGPGLEFLIERSAAYADKVTFVHAEVYADPAGTTVAPAVEALGLQYEPVMFFTDAGATVTNRVDIIWDADELGDLLAAAFS